MTTSLFKLSLVFLTGVLRFSLYRYYASIVKLIPHFYLLNFFGKWGAFCVYLTDCIYENELCLFVNFDCNHLTIFFYCLL